MIIYNNTTRYNIIIINITYIVNLSNSKSKGNII